MARKKNTPSLPMVMASSASAPASPPPTAAPASPPPAAAPAPAAASTQSQTAAQPQQAASLITATANGSNHGTKVDLQAVYQAVIAGLLEFYAPTDVFQMSSGTYPRDELIAELQQFVTAAQNTKDSNAQWREDIQTERGLEQHVRVLRVGVKGIVAARFGATGAQLLKFGFTLPKPRKKSAQTKAVAVAKSLATRSKRQTLGKVQKKDIKGNVSVNLVVTPADGGSQSVASATTSNAGAQPTQSPAAAPSAAPAPAAPSNGAAQATAAPVALAVPTTHPGTNGQ
ncbi:MAG TPA: hypothetical protein VF765_11835 [Polyangiaceae bacterium]